ncbi:hypothetical protein RIV26_000911 [Listeria monocytogenes]|nr:hypothetical protein [Listeria monocytogenes]ELC2326001.1 hypothetical protein [Listeria monocytogenes]HAO5717082.1 hypothetical protein [Listeria monocytogenes]
MQRMSSEPLGKKTITVNFYKPSGKWYAGGTAVVSTYIFDEEAFLEEIGKTNTCFKWDWRNSSFDLVTNYESDDPEDRYFCNYLWKLAKEWD